jgi:hypothetical protein
MVCIVYLFLVSFTAIQYNELKFEFKYFHILVLNA